MMNYKSLDFMQMESLLSEEEIMIRDTVRSFVEKEVIPVLQSAHREEKFPMDLIPRFGEINLLGSSIEGYGCAGLKDVTYGLIMQELERGDSGVRSFCSVQGALVMWPLFHYGSEEQKKKFLPELAKGNLIGCFGLTEPDAGSNPQGMQARAKKTKGGYILNGNKIWITNGSIADVAVVWAYTDEKTVQGFLIEKDFKGFSTSLMEGKFSLRVSVTSELHFEDCFVPDSHVLPKAQGLKTALRCLTQARYGIAWGVIGAANQCYHTALEYAKERIIFDKSLASYQLAQAKLVKMVQEITKAQFLVLQLGRLKEKGELKPHHVSLCKMNNCRMALEIARESRDLLGANGIIDEYPIIRHMLNLETVNTYEGTEDIHRLFIGKTITGQGAYR